MSPESSPNAPTPEVPFTPKTIEECTSFEELFPLLEEIDAKNGSSIRIIVEDVRNSVLRLSSVPPQLREKVNQLLAKDSKYEAPTIHL